MDPELTRRELGMLTAGGLAAASVAGGLVTTATAQEGVAVPLAYGTRSSRVAVAPVPKGSPAEVTEAAVREAALAVSDFSWLSRGDHVLLKPACNSGNAYPATTDPAALRAMIALLKERGAGRVVVADMSGVQSVRFSKDHVKGSTRALMESSGMARAVTDAGGELHAFEEAGWDGFFPAKPTAEGSWSGELMLPAILQETDHVVLMPRCSRHLLAGSTLGLKAAVGWWRHDTRLEYHGKAGTFAQKTADANTVPAIQDRQRLVVTSATEVLATLGPDDGYVVKPDTGLVFASTDVVAHDMVSLAWLIHGRRAAPEDQRKGMSDPNEIGTVVNLANKVVCQWLGGIGDAFRAERLERWSTDTVFEDEVLRRAFALAGGVPRVEIEPIGAGLPEALRSGLEREITLAA